MKRARPSCPPPIGRTKRRGPQGALRRAKRCAWGAASLEDVDDGEHEQPDHVHEVPIPGCGPEREVLLGRDLTPKHRSVHHVEEDQPQQDVKPWKPVSMKKVVP